MAYDVDSFAQAVQEATTRIVVAFISHNQMTVDSLPGLIEAVSTSLGRIGAPTAEVAPPPLQPAVPVKKSITKDYIICLEDGAKLRTLTRYLKARFQLSPDAYRHKWGLPPDYPMIAPGYSALRSELAKKSGLGRPKPTPPARSRRKTRGN